MPRTLPKTLTEDEVNRLRSAPNLSVATGLRDRCIIELMLTCGLRVGETCQLHLRDVDWKAGEIRLRPEITKGGVEAVVYLTEPTQQLLERWKLEPRRYGAGKPHLFVSVRQATRGRPLTPRAVEKMLARRSAKVGVSHTWPHRLRHTFATSSLAEGFTITEVQKLMRHSRLSTTSVYLHVRDEDLKAKVRRRGAAA